MADVTFRDFAGAVMRSDEPALRQLAAVTRSEDARFDEVVALIEAASVRGDPRRG
jgi:hypothetical protein